MKNYRLKREAVPFLKEKYATRIDTYEFWEAQAVNNNALEEVEDAYLTYGHHHNQGLHKMSIFSGWSEKGSRFHFTVHFPSTNIKEYDLLKNDESVRDLMIEIQKTINLFIKDYTNHT